MVLTNTKSATNILCTVLRSFQNVLCSKASMTRLTWHIIKRLHHQGNNIELGNNKEAKYVSSITKSPAPVKARVRGREREDYKDCVCERESDVNRGGVSVNAHLKHRVSVKPMSNNTEFALFGTAQQHIFKGSPYRIRWPYVLIFSTVPTLRFYLKVFIGLFRTIVCPNF